MNSFCFMKGSVVETKPSRLLIPNMEYDEHVNLSMFLKELTKKEIFLCDISEDGTFPLCSVNRVSFKNTCRVDRTGGEAI